MRSSVGTNRDGRREPARRDNARPDRLDGVATAFVGASELLRESGRGAVRHQRVTVAAGLAGGAIAILAMGVSSS
jgi:hypothetical protein